MKNWRPPDWKGMPKCVRFSVIEPDFLAKEVYEAGADGILEALKPRLETIYAQLNGIRMKEGKTSWYSALDASIDELKQILGIPADDKGGKL